LVVDIDEGNLKAGLLALVISLVEVIKDALKLQAFKRMEGGSLTEEEIDRLGRALADLDVALEQLKADQGIAEAVQQVRDGLDELVDDVLDRFLNPQSWLEESERSDRVGAH
jgi:DNA invertase Pin-like site-specific DNA recombinase